MPSENNKMVQEVVFYLLDITVQNSYAIFEVNNKNLELSECLLQLAQKLIEEYDSKWL